jgi:hypothetical protein
MQTWSSWLKSTWTGLGEWSNVEIYRYKKLEIRRLDVLLLLMGIGIAIYYYLFYTWQTMVLGVAMYVMVLMVALWML